MSNHLTQTQIDNYRRRWLSASELVSVSDHLSACEVCRRQVKRPPVDVVVYLTLKSEVFGEAEILASAIGPAHLTGEQTAEYIDGTLAGENLQIVKDHLTCCKQCLKAVNDLRAFKNQVALKLNLEYKPSLTPVAAGSRELRLVAVLHSLWPKFPVLIFGPVLSVFLLAVIGWLVWHELQRTKTKPEVTVTVPSPRTSPPDLTSPTPEFSGAIVIARLNDAGGQVTMDQEGKLSGVDYLPPAYQQMVKRALINQKLERPKLLTGLTQPGRTPRSDDHNQKAEFSLIGPVGKVTLSDHPTFRWSRLDGATTYVVEVYDEQFALVASSPQIIDPTWTAPRSFKRGITYSWLVKAVKDGQIFVTPSSPATQGQFHILDQARADDLARARRAYASSHLTMGLLYFQAGLIDEADRELCALQKSNPNSVIVRQLLARVRALRRS